MSLNIFCLQKKIKKKINYCRQKNAIYNLNALIQNLADK